MSGGGGGGSLSNVSSCGTSELLLFVLAVFFGTFTSICSKTMMSMSGTNGAPSISTSIDNEGGVHEEVDVLYEPFRKPLFQTFGMFVGMLFGLVMHAVVVALELPFPGYDHRRRRRSHRHHSSANGELASTALTTVRSMTTDGEKRRMMGATEATSLIANNNNGGVEQQDASFYDDSETTTALLSGGMPTSVYFLLAIPAVFDLGATALCMMGLQYLDVSIYQMLRGSGIIFVALMKQHVLKEHLQKFHWVGVFWNVVSVLIVGGTALLASSSSSGVGGGGGGSGYYNDTAADGGGGGVSSSSSASGGGVTASETLLGVSLMIAGAFVQAIQFVFEERVMKMDVPVPPLLLIGMEGFWGVVIGVFVMYPIGYLLPGDDHGSYEDPFNTWAMLVHSRNIQVAFSIYFFTIFMYNVFAVLVTFQLSSIWHAILDNFRPITVWATDLFIFYYINPLFGEVWTRYSYLQIAGMGVLLYGTAIYNAPNDGSLLLEGQWWAFGIDLSEEYDAIRREQEETELEAQWDKKQLEFKKKRLSSFMTSPKISVHTQALVGIGAQRY